MFSKAGFEGREENAVMESKRKGIPDLCSGEAEGTATMLFSFEDGMLKVLSSEELRGLEGHRSE